MWNWNFIDICKVINEGIKGGLYKIHAFGGSHQVLLEKNKTIMTFEVWTCEI